ncbi:MAG: GTP cyclohydrolase I FolE2 [Polyangiaceae bacterium]|nr:GTP cyclohydrolase I FolE2 [Polyangiaceae bacterium]
MTIATFEKATKLQTVEDLLTWGGAWAARAMVDVVAEGLLENALPRIEFVERILNASEGAGAQAAQRRIEGLIGRRLTSNPSKTFSSPPKPVLDLSLRHRWSRTRCDSNEWLDKLCSHLDCNTSGLANTLDVLDRRDAGLPEHFFDQLRGWSWQILPRLFGSPLLPPEKAFKVIQTDWASACWRRWYRYGDEVALLISLDDRECSRSRSTVWRLIHDATHLYHMAAYPGSQRQNDPIWLCQMESLAILAECKYLDLLTEEREQFSRPEHTELDKDALVTWLLVGLLERSLRIDYDVAVHAEGEQPDRWREITLRRTGIPRQVLAFTDEFHGLPGLPAAYLLGANVAEACADTEGMFAGRSVVLQLYADHIETLSLDPSTDVPNYSPTLALPLSRVGTAAAKTQLTYASPFDHSHATSSVATVSVTCSLKSTQRGVHMSRFQESINALSQRQWPSISEAATWLANAILEGQGQDQADASIEVEHIVSTNASITGKSSSQTVRLRAKTKVSRTEASRCSVSLSIGVMTACPCTLQYSRLLAQRELLQSASVRTRSPFRMTVPTFTHSQPGDLLVEVSSVHAPPSYLELLKAIRSAAHVRESVLKRPDEHELVQRAHQRPQFCEDVVRAVAFAAASRISETDSVYIQVRLDESIHPHSVTAEFEGIAGDLWKASR